MRISNETSHPPACRWLSSRSSTVDKRWLRMDSKGHKHNRQLPIAQTLTVEMRVGQNPVNDLGYVHLQQPVDHQ